MSRASSLKRFLRERVDQTVGIVIVDHGSKRAESNAMLLEVAQMFRQATGCSIVEPAHMELAAPTLAQAFDRCVSQGAQFVVVFPYFLLPGRHWDTDIPALAEEAAKRHAGVRWLVTAPLGLHALMMEIISDRIAHCVRHSQGDGPECEMCSNTEKCRINPRPDAP